MTRRGKRLTLGVMAVGLAVIVGLAVTYRKPILEHVEAWRFQLTTETATTRFCFPLEGPTVVIEEEFEEEYSRRVFRLVRGGTAPLQALRQKGFRVLEQRFPRRAYVVIRDEHAPIVSEGIGYTVGEPITIECLFIEAAGEAMPAE